MPDQINKSNSQLVEDNTNQAPTEEEDFETAVTKLEAIINEIEDGEVSLEDSILRYKEGMRLINECQKKLAEVEQQIKILDNESNDLKNYQ
jgi:exodeoxyribonuclease VII small subunit